MLKQFDQIQEQETGMPSWLPQIFRAFSAPSPSCYQDSCNLFARVSRRNQKLYLSVGGRVQYVWPVSTGRPGYETPDFDQHPDGRVYDKYSSTTFPGGDWKGLGKMPYAVFIHGGFAIDGTPPGQLAQTRPDRFAWVCATAPGEGEGFQSPHPGEWD